ncbi:hypothetical protein PRK78_004499 [Emydomyces testavorans]|uniref:Uncharacterized protein n=1 Tax=Emydomyces testavorans TaxID=2070801 RepID=A0AAF0DKC0_9EURO|nr:hypothetical protein PRK78_004499 [Emydomyces testavorans]
MTSSSSAGPAHGSNPGPPTSSPSLSRRVSQNMAHPLHYPRTPSVSSSTLGSGDNTGVGNGPGPLRHPRPMTVADLHLQLEKEQEAVVNRLTRELSLLRQQTASVASTASSASTNVNEPADHPQLPGLSNPRSRNRSSSTLSSRSFAGGTSLPIGSVTGIIPSRDGAAPTTSRQPMDYHRGSRSREPSIVSRGPSGTASPSFSSSFQQHGEYLNSSQTQSHPHSHSYRASQTLFPAANNSVQDDPQRGSISTAQAAARYEEASYHRAELEAAKRENEMLRRRVRELEATVREYRRLEDGGRTRSSERISNLTAELRAASVSDDHPTAS